jgi:GntR family transcriptional regulator
MNSRNTNPLFVPAYIKIKNNIQSMIATGMYQAGDKLPSEAAFSDTFKVSRITIRLALKELLNQGVIYSKQGKGSFVSLPTMSSISGFRGFSEDMRSKGMAPSSVILEATTTFPDQNIAAHLNIDPSEPIFVLKRVRLASNIPVVVEIAHLPLTLLPNFGNHDLTRSIFTIFREEYGIIPAWIDNQIQAILATEEIAGLLQLKFNDPILKIICSDYTESFKVIEYVISYYNGNAYTFSTGRQSII